MGRSKGRVLTVTTNHALVVGLTFLERGWDVVSQPDLAGAPDGDVLVLDLGDTESARVALAAAPEIEVPTIVIGDRDGDLPGDVRLLVRPFEMSDLADRIGELLSARKTDGRRKGEPSAQQAPDVDAGAARAPAGPDGSAPDTSDTAEHVVDLTETAGSDQIIDVTEKPRPATDDLRARDDLDPGNDGGTAGAGGPARRGAPDGGAGGVAEPPRRMLVSAKPVVPADAEGLPSAPARSATSATSAPSLPTAPAGPTVRAPATSTSSAVGRTGDRRVERSLHAGSTTAAPAPRRPSRWFARRVADVEPDAGAELDDRLVTVLGGLTELERLIAEVPLLRSVPALSAAIVHELRSALDADTAALWERTAEGWRVVAGLGLTPYEARTPVPLDQPLMGEIEATLGALLIDPIDQAHAAVAGIGGAHARSFMAASLVVADDSYGIATVGRDRRLTDRDLDALVALTAEAAPGLAVARHIARLAPPDAEDVQEQEQGAYLPRSERARPGSRRARAGSDGDGAEPSPNA